MANHQTIDARITEVRARLAANLGELQHRVTRARQLMSPRTYLASPWAQLGLGLAIGFVAGRRRSPKLLTAGPGGPRHVESLLHAALRSTVMTLAAAVIQRALGHAASESEDDPDRSGR